MFMAQMCASDRAYVPIMTSIKHVDAEGHKGVLPRRVLPQIKKRTKLAPS